MDDSTCLCAYTVSRGDTIAIRYDTAFILNRLEFSTLKSYYEKVKNASASNNSLIQTYEEIIAKQDNMLKEKEFYYQNLKSAFDNLTSTTNQFVDRTDANITAINTSLTKATSELNNAKASMDDALSKLKLVNRQKWKLAIGGFTVGIAVAAVIFVIAR